MAADKKELMLQALQNSATQSNIVVHHYFENDKRRTTNCFHLTQDGTSISGKLTYDQANHFLLGWSKCEKSKQKS